MDPTLCQHYDDTQLVSLAIGDSQYFYCLMRRYEEALLRYVHRLINVGPDDASDIVEDSFINAYQHLNDCDCSLKFSSWLYRIVHNQAINFLKKHKLALKISIDQSDDDFLDWLASDTDIEKQAITNHFNDHIRHLIGQLSSDYQSVLLLRFYEDKNYQEISDILQKPIGTVATLLSRAKIQFKKIYDQEK